MRHSLAPRHARGAALIVSLILLLVMTILGISGIQTTTMETRMAANSADRNLALQAAEHALRVAEADVLAKVESGEYATEFGKTPGLYNGLQLSTDKDKKECTSQLLWRDDTATWNSDDSIEVNIKGTDAFQPLHLNANPRYMAAYNNDLDTASPCYSDISPEGFSNSLGSTAEPLTVQRFTITVIGYGAQPNTRVRLQEFYSVLR